MDDETAEMEAITAEMREVMRAWIDNPDDSALKVEYVQLQAEYERAFLALKGLGAASEELTLKN